VPARIGKILPSVFAQARKVFGSKSEMIAFIKQDPEFTDSYLCLTIRLQSYDDNVTRLLDRVTEPFEAELCNSSGYLLVTTDFLKPYFRNPKEESDLDFWEVDVEENTKKPKEKSILDWNDTEDGNTKGAT
jgi:hypothetical protein